ncbi:aaRS-interacting multifunctional protein 3 isoform X2 [Augochlora pura]
MVLCPVQCLEKISNYLEVVGMEQTSNEKTKTGFSMMIQLLTENSKCPEIFGNNNEEEALSRQWLEYAIVCFNCADIPANTKRILQELNIALRDNTYLSGTKKTIADITLYYFLHPIMQKLTYQEKAQYVHVSRWFDNMQQEKKLRQQLDMISFYLLHLFI